MKSVFMVAFHYPPDNSSTGVLRTLKFTQYVGEFGWHPHVFTVDPFLYPFRDSDLDGRVPRSVEVTRVWCPDVKRAFGFRGRYPGWLAVPDRFNGWVLSGYRPALRILARQQFDLIYSTQPVPTAHLLAWRLKQATGLPWVADFRDPWVEGTITGLRGRIEGWLEKQVVMRSDRIICNTPRMRKDFLNRYPDVPRTRFVVITNGYDESDFVDLPGPTTEGPMTIVYPGVVDPGNRNPLPLIEAIGLAVRSGGISVTDLSLFFLGGGSFLFTEAVERAIREWGLEKVTVRIKERVPYRESLRRLAQADVLVVLSEPVGNGPRIEAEKAYSQMMVPAKVYEYLRLGRPILALVGDGAVRDLLESVGSGYAVPANRPEKAADFLIQCYVERKRLRSGQHAVSAAVAAYERRALAERLSEEFDKVTGTRNKSTVDAHA